MVINIDFDGKTNHAHRKYKNDGTYYYEEHPLTGIYPPTNVILNYKEVHAWLIKYHSKKYVEYESVNGVRTIVQPKLKQQKRLS